MTESTATVTRTRAKQRGFKGEGFPQPIPEVEAASQEVADKLRAKNKAKEKYDTAVAQCIEIMERHGIDHMKIDEGGKMVQLTRDPKLKIVKVRESASAGSDSDE
jgi:hypothetical protein